jgi:hypothetical protein
MLHLTVGASLFPCLAEGLDKSRAPSPQPLMARHSKAPRLPAVFFFEIKTAAFSDGQDHFATLGK